MGRKLPWDREEPALRPEKRGAQPPHSSSAPRASTLSLGDSGACSPRQKKRRTRYDSAAGRMHSPSTSPPVCLVPVEEFMHDGLDADDGYRMVEDEFFVTAHYFTAHLHRAEYERLKALARARHGTAINDIVRPTVGVMSEVAQRHAAVRTRDGLRPGKIPGGHNYDEDADDDGAGRGKLPWTGTLQGLMESSRRARRPLLEGLAAVKGTGMAGATKASIGLRPDGRGLADKKEDGGVSKRLIGGGVRLERVANAENLEPNDDDDDGDDDLDAPVKKSTAGNLNRARGPRGSTVPVTVTRRGRPWTSDQDPSASFPSRPAPAHRASSASSYPTGGGKDAPVPSNSSRRVSPITDALASRINPDNDEDLFVRLRERRATARSRQAGQRKNER